MEPKIIATIACAVFSVGGLVGLIVFCMKDKIKAANVFGCIGLASSIGLIVMGAVIHRWWVWVPAIILVLASGFFLLGNNYEDPPPPPNPDDEDDDW